MWTANCSDGSNHEEKWIDGEISPWQRLMYYCAIKGEYLTDLKLTLRDKTVFAARNAAGYWQAQAIPTVQGIECDEELHKISGIGWTNDMQTIHIIWGALDPVTKEPTFWNDQRQVDTQNQTIFTPIFG